METAIWSIIVLMIVAVITFVQVITTFNQLVSERESVKSSWSQIEVQLTRRHALIPNLVNVAEQYGVQESDAFARIVEARSAALGATGVAERAQAEGVLGEMAGNVFVIMEAYPSLKSDQHFLNLQSNWSETENHIAHARVSYNDAVRRYNSSLGQFPRLLVAAMFLFSKAKYFDANNAIGAAVVTGASI